MYAFYLPVSCLCTVQNNPRVLSRYIGANGFGRRGLAFATPGKVVWTYATGGEVDSSVTVYDGVAYFGSYDANMYAVNASTGAFIRKYPTTGDVESSAVVVNGTVYFGCDDGYVYAYGTADGTLRWKVSAGGAIFSTPRVHRGRLYVGAQNGMTVLDLNSGAVVKTFGEGDVYSTAAFASTSQSVTTGNSLFFGSTAAAIYAVDLSTGVLRWQTSVNGAVYSTVIVNDGVLYAGTFGSMVYALNATNGAVIWQTSVGGNIFGAPAFADGMLYFGAWDDNLYAVNAKTGNTTWTVSVGDIVDRSPVVYKGVVYATSGNGVYAVSTSGTIQWTFASPQGGAFYTVPWIYNDMVLVGSDDNSAYALSIK